MNRPLSDNPIELNIDVDQWRRDVQTFASTTKRVLDAIAAELSNDCAKNVGEIQTIQRVRPNPESALPSSSSVNPKDSQGEDRLAKLKDQLAKRISKSN